MNPGQIRVVLIGIGKIARDQHLPAIAADRDFELGAVVSLQDPGILRVPYFPKLTAFFDSGIAADAMIMCTPPQIRFGEAYEILAGGLNLFLEKPPCSALSEVAALETRADEAGLTLFASWHSRFAGGVGRARACPFQRSRKRRRPWWMSGSGSGPER